MKTPYETRQIERIIASAIARRFAHSVSEKQGEQLLAAQKAANEAAHTFRMEVEAVVNELLR